MSSQIVFDGGGDRTKLRFDASRQPSATQPTAASTPPSAAQPSQTASNDTAALSPDADGGAAAPDNDSHVQAMGSNFTPPLPPERPADLGQPDAVQQENDRWKNQISHSVMQ